MIDMHDAEDIADGGPLASPDDLAQRILDAVSEAYDRGAEESWDGGYEQGINESLRDALSMLDPAAEAFEIVKHKGPMTTDDVAARIAEIGKAWRASK